MTLPVNVRGADVRKRMVERHHRINRMRGVLRNLREQNCILTDGAASDQPQPKNPPINPPAFQRTVSAISEAFGEGRDAIKAERREQAERLWLLKWEIRLRRNITMFRQTGLRFHKTIASDAVIAQTTRLCETHVTADGIATVSREFTILSTWAHSCFNLQDGFNERWGLNSPVILGAVRIAADDEHVLYRARIWHSHADVLRAYGGADIYIARSKRSGHRERPDEFGGTVNQAVMLFGVGPTPAGAEWNMHADIARDMIERL